MCLQQCADVQNPPRGLLQPNGEQGAVGRDRGSRGGTAPGVARLAAEGQGAEATSCEDQDRPLEPPPTPPAQDMTTAFSNLNQSVHFVHVIYTLL